ncbi:MAG: dihydrodipicolinate synthase family protein [Bacteroidetes bacterium]|nr:MAG: dihydrodipicolinate synthase family protein [Bacteroidota bacterium]
MIPGNISLSGIFPPMLTPFKKNGDVDYDAFTRNIEKWNQYELGGYLVLGSNSETSYLTEDEKLKLIELTVQAAAKGKTILAGTGMESTRETIRLTNEAARCGAHAALVLTPCYYGGNMTDTALIHHFTAVAENMEIPILLYNVPKFTNINLTAEVVRVLSEHPNIIGMKDSKGDAAQLEIFKNAASPDFTVIVGTASTLYPALALGIRAGILALANCAPAECIQIYQSFLQGKEEEAEKNFTRMLPVNKAVTGTYGIPGLKYAATLLGYEGGMVRSPLLELTDAEKETMKNILKEAGLLL